MTAFIGNIIAGLQNAASTAKAAKEAREKSRTADGRRIYRVACIGHANAGKTTFWTVLEGATREHSDGFNLQTGDRPTKAYLDRQIETMQQGALWAPGEGERTGDTPGVYEPGYPNRGDEVANLLFMVRQPGQIEFPMMVQDYPGGSIAVEDTEGGYTTVVEFLKSADGVMFMLDSNVSRLARAAIDQQLAAFRSLLRLLEDQRGMIRKPVAVVFAKADTLPGFRPGVPASLLSPADLRRRHEPFSRFLEQLLRGAAFSQDPAWKERITKTMSRVQSFADTLLKKCDAPQFFFVSAVGDKRRRPIEGSREDASILASRIGSSLAGVATNYTVGRNQVGLETPVAWIANELAVTSVVTRWHSIRNRALIAALLWSILVSLPFMAYLGCSTARIEHDLQAETLQGPRFLRDVHRFEEDYYARLWVLADKEGFMMHARTARASASEGIVDEAVKTLRRIVDGLDGNLGGPDQGMLCRKWALSLNDCFKVLPAGTEGQGNPMADRIRCLAQFYTSLDSAFAMSSSDARREALAGLIVPGRFGTCPPQIDSVRAMIDQLIHHMFRVALARGPATITAAVYDGSPPYAFVWNGPDGAVLPGDSTCSVGAPGLYRVQVTDQAGRQTTAEIPVTGQAFADQYNQILAGYDLTSPVKRLNPQLLARLHQMQPAVAPADARSRRAWDQINSFLQRVAPFEIGVTLRLQLSLSEPVRVRIDASSTGYFNGSVAEVSAWRLSQPLRFTFFRSGVAEQPSRTVIDVLGNVDPIQVPASIKANDGTPAVLSYEVLEPTIDDASVPPLQPVP